MHKLPWLPGKVDCKIIDVPSPLPDINDIVQSSDQLQILCHPLSEFHFILTHTVF